MLAKSQETENQVFEKVEKGKYSSRSKAVWTKLDGATALPDFPRLTQEQLVDLTCGTQLKQANSYTEEHVSERGDYEILFAPERDGDLLRLQVQSRHKGRTMYYTWLQYNATHITGWCQCKAGKRTVGCCAHVASVLWYLAYARHNGYNVRSNRWWKHLLDAAGEGGSDSEEDMPE